MSGSVELTVQDYMAAVLMGRPPVNAQNSECRHELITTFDSPTDHDGVRVVILTNTFSGGAGPGEAQAGVLGALTMCRHSSGEPRRHRL